MKLQDWQLRVYAERAELSNKLDKLNEFMSSAESVVSAAEYRRLERQSHVMTDYVSILSERIQAFEVSDG